MTKNFVGKIANSQICEFHFFNFSGHQCSPMMSPGSNATGNLDDKITSCLEKAVNELAPKYKENA